MTQNRSSAVMQQRREPHTSLDDFPTPPWATRALCEWLERAESLPVALQHVREPAANRGFMARPLGEYFGVVEVSDIHDYGMGWQVRDYLFPPDPHLVDWTITNPPFRLAAQFIAVALRTSRRGVAMFVRLAFLEGQERYRDLFSVTPPSFVLQFSERVVIHRGRIVKDGSSATAYCWLVWFKHPRLGGTIFEWLPPCRARLELDGDYDALGASE